MRKLLLPILLLIMFIPFYVNAESKYLYDVLKEEAESGGLAKEYTGEHHDSYTEYPSKKIYHWYAENDDEGNQVLEKNNVIFAERCWQMIRTTDTGGVKMIYNGMPKDIYRYLNIPRQDYSIVSNTANFTWNEESETWNAVFSDTSTKNISFKISENNYYNLYFNIEASSDWGFKIYKDSSTVKIGGSPTIYHDFQHQFGELENTNVIKFEFNNYRTPSTSSKVQIKMLKRDELISVGCDSSEYETQLSNLSSFNWPSKSPAYVGYKFNKETLLEMQGNDAAADGSLFGNDVIYEDNNYTLINTSLTYDNYHHYTCNNTTGKCPTVRYYYYDNYYTIIDDGRTIEKALQDMLNNDNLNIHDSTIKAKIDSWYEENIIYNSSFIEDTIFCNDRTVKDYGGWNPNGGSGSLTFINNTFSYSSLKCPNVTDQFSVSNPKAKLKYPVALLSSPEFVLLNNNQMRKTGKWYWSLSPFYFNKDSYNRGIATNGATQVYTTLNDSNGVRPSISLVPNIKYSSGDGSKVNPYIIKTVYNYSNIIVNNDNQKGLFILDNFNNIKEDTIVKFFIQSNDGYKVSSITIKDLKNNIIEYQSNENGYEYSIVMPESDVTITPIYEKVKSSINVEIVNETEDLNVRINDMTQVEYEEIVKFNVTPIKGYKVTTLKIIDEENNEMEYQETDNQNEYSFIMPASNVTIIPLYERVKSSINIEDNKNTKEIIIEVNDSKAVVYEDIVKFIVTPEDGYEVDKIEITDKENNKIDYIKTKNENEYEFVMPDTDVIIIPTYRKIESINVPNTLKNPNTGTRNSIIIIVMLIISSITYIIFKKKKNYIMK